jgi:hypothetical protein
MKKRLLLGLCTVAFLGALPATASADVGGADPTPASCMGIEAAALSPPGSSEEVPSGLPGLRVFLREVAPGVPPGQAFFSFVARLHEGSHELCDEAIEG